MKTKLKQIAEHLETFHPDFITQEISLMLDGSYNSEHIYTYLLDTLDITKKNFGKRGANTKAFIGIESITRLVNVNRQQAISIYKYLPKSKQDEINQIIEDLLIDFYNENIKRI